MTRRNLLLASTLSSGGGVQEPEWPVYLTSGEPSEIDSQLYNYLRAILPDGVYNLPITEYNIGSIIINYYGTYCHVVRIAVFPDVEFINLFYMGETLEDVMIYSLYGNN